MSTVLQAPPVRVGTGMRQTPRWYFRWMCPWFRVKKFGNYDIGKLRHACLKQSEITRTPRGKIILAARQIWVEQSDDIWVIVALIRRTNRALFVFIRPYHCWKIRRVLSESRFRSRMRILQEVVEERSRLEQPR